MKYEKVSFISSQQPEALDEHARRDELEWRRNSRRRARHARERQRWLQA